MKKAIVIILLALAVIVVCVCFLLHKARVPAKEGICKLKFKTVGMDEGILALATRYVAAVTQKPSELKDLPKGVSDDCSYFLARLGGEDVPMIVDSHTDMSGRYVRWRHILYVDTDGDNCLAEEKGFVGKAQKTQRASPVGYYRFGPISVESDSTENRLKREFYVATRNGRSLKLYPTGCRVGKVRLGKNVYKVAFIDGNFDGRYDELFSPPVEDVRRAGCDSCVIHLNGDYRLDHVSYRLCELMPLSKMLKVEDNYYSINIASDGRALELKKVEPEFGTLDPGGADLELLAWSDIAHQLLSGSKQEWRLPAGKYTALSIELNQTDSSGSRLTFRSSPETGKLKDFEIRPGETTVFRIGPPFSIKTSAEQRGEIVLIGFGLQGQAGVLYDPGARKGRTTIPAPKFKIVDEAGKVVDSGQFEHG